MTMKLLSPILVVTVFCILTITTSQALLAQNNIEDNIQVGASVAYSTLHYDKDAGDVLNDIISYDAGFQLNALIAYDLSDQFSLQTGFEYFYFTYEFEDQISPETGSNGGTTGNYFKSSVTENFSTSYLTVPVRLQFHPLETVPLYITTGPDFSYKIGYDNGRYETVFYSENDEKQEVVFNGEYNLPEEANDFLMSAVAGLGYSFKEKNPLTLELKGIHSITPYLSGGNYIDSWIRSVSLTIFYDL